MENPNPEPKTTSTELHLPKELADVPIMKLEDLLETRKVKLHNQGGQDSIGLTVEFTKINNGQSAISFLKMYTLDPEITAEDIKFIFNACEVNPTNMTLSEAAETLHEGRKDQEYEDQIIRSALGFKKGHELLPNDVPNLQSMVIYKGKLIGHISEFADGESSPPNPSDSRIQTLEINDITVDTTDGALNLVGNKLVDLFYEGTLNYSEST